MSEWKKVKLGDTFKVKKGQAITKRESKEGPYPVILGGREPAYFIDRYNHEGKAIVVSRSGASAGYVSFWNEPIFITDGFLIEPNNDVCYEYIYYLMKNNQTRFIGSQKGAAIPHVTPALLSDIDVFLPPFETQQKIAGILSAYDDLIENNRKQIKLLEEAAQKLYKEWFVKLNFPGHENVKIVDGVPEGWKKEKVGNIIKTLPKTKQVKTAETLSNGEIPVIDQSRDFIAGYTNDKETIIKSETPVIVFGDHTRILKLIQFPFARGADGTQVFISINNCIKEYQLYCALVEIDLSNYSYARHFKYLKEQEILIPTKELSEKFETFVKSNYQLIQKLRDKIQLLQSARDKLLPKLMNGELITN